MKSKEDLENDLGYILQLIDDAPEDLKQIVEQEHELEVQSILEQLEVINNG